MTTNGYQPLDFALSYCSRGWRVFPIMPHTKDQPLCKWGSEATDNEKQVREWWGGRPEANIGIATGRTSGFVVLDVDADKGGDESLLSLAVEHGRLPDTPESLTGGGGRHILFLHPGVEIRNSAGKLGPGLDIRGDGGYIVAPPSIHPSGKRYEWEVSSRPSSVPISPLPRWLFDMLTAGANGAPDGNNGYHGEAYQAGTRNDSLTRMAGLMRRHGLSGDAVYQALLVENAEKCMPPLSDSEVHQIALSIARYEPAERKNGREPLPYRELAGAGGGLDSFVDLLSHLEGRSVPTFVPSLDEATAGLERQTLTVLAARPSMGKTTLAWQIARNVAASKRKVLFYSLEMSHTSLWAKAVCGALGIRWRDIRRSERATPEQLGKILKQAEQFKELYARWLFVDDGANDSATMRIGIEQHQPDLVIVDHLRLVADKGENEIQRLGKIAATFKEYAKEYNLAFLCLAQLNRGVESRDDKRPLMADLRDSGQIEEVGDLILMIYRPDYYDANAKDALFSPTELHIRKYRDDVARQKCELLYDLRHQWFIDAKEQR